MAAKRYTAEVEEPEPPVHPHSHPHPEPHHKPPEEPPHPEPAAGEAPSQLAVPTSFTALVDPYAKKGTHFDGPILSGPMSQPPFGIALLTKRAHISYTQGNFSVPIVLPPGAILIKMFTAQQTAYNGTTPTIEVDQANGGTIMHASPVSLAGAVLIETPFTLLPLPATWTVWLKQTVSGATAGVADVIIQYSVPARMGPS